MSFKSEMIDDVDKVFLDTDTFGETVTLIRSGTSYSIKGLYDELPLNGEDLGGGVDAISHNPRLFISTADLPNNVPKKGDIFVLTANELHGAKRIVAKDFELPKDGMVVYYLKDKSA